MMPYCISCMNQECWGWRGGGVDPGVSRTVVRELMHVFYQNVS